MMFFIESVTTYSTSGKTRKGYAIQKALKPFEHIILISEQAFDTLLANIERLVVVCNAKYRGAELFVSCNKQADCGQISVHPQPTGNESPVITISYGIVADEFSHITVRHKISNTIRTYAPDIAEHFGLQKGGEA